MVLIGMSAIGTVLIVWGAVLVVVVAALALGTRRRRPRGAPAVEERREGGDRRVGRPDTRLHKVERRSGLDRRRRPVSAI